MPRNLARVFCEAIIVQRRVFKTRTGKGFSNQGKGFTKLRKGFFETGKQRRQDEKQREFSSKGNGICKMKRLLISER